MVAEQACPVPLAVLELDRVTVPGAAGDLPCSDAWSAAELALGKGRWPGLVLPEEP